MMVMKKVSNLGLIVTILLLTFLGALNMFGIRPDLFLSHLTFLVVGIVFFFVFKRLSFIIFETHSGLFFIFFVVCLIVVLIFGQEIRGAKRWLSLLFFSFQPSEFFKPFFILYLSKYLSQIKPTASLLTQTIAIFSFPIALILVQPDLGSAILFGIILLSLLFFSGIKWQYFVFFIITGTVSLPAIFQLLHDYQRARIFSFISPESDPLGLSYNLSQSTISVGSGGLMGKGLGLATQSKFRFLPEYHTDFAFASFVEQFGFIGSIALLSLYFILIYLLLRRFAALKGQLIKRLYLLGVVCLLFSSITINIGMNIAILPVTGIALPFISYGGTVTLATLIMLGIAASL